jgi:hypothetical protein
VHLKNTSNRVLFSKTPWSNIVLVFHRILDFKAGLDIYPGPFLFPLTEHEDFPLSAFISCFSSRFLPPENQSSDNEQLQ